MNDRELLELAAKAARINGEWGGMFELGDGTAIDTTDMFFVENYPWNPLEDDADALRLAADLDLFGLPTYWHWLSIARLENKTDKYANVRIAIVRAAAEIARAQGEKQ